MGRVGERGFTIIELMIVVTIIGILSAIAIPVYQGYVTRAKISEAMLLFDPYRVAVSDRLVQSGGLPADNAAADFQAPTEDKGRYVRSVEVRDGVVVLTFGDPALAGLSITMTPSMADNMVTWSCTSTLPDHLKPKDCG
ncbi:MAG TPA: pilin [Verrucomicrobiae bacterium]|nr:pilin [Verrucomicrobiae bacterium]